VRTASPTPFQRHELQVPENTWPGRVPRFASMREACEAGVEPKVANAAHQERLAVFGNLRAATNGPEMMLLRGMQHSTTSRLVQPASQPEQFATPAP